MMGQAVPPCDTNREEDANRWQILISKGYEFFMRHLRFLSMRRTRSRNAGKDKGKGPVGL